MKYLIFLLFAQVAFCPRQTKSQAGAATKVPVAPQAQQVVPDYVFKVGVGKDGKQFGVFDKTEAVKELLKITPREQKVIKLDDRNSTVIVTPPTSSQPSDIKLELILDPNDQVTQFKEKIGAMCYYLLKCLQVGLDRLPQNKKPRNTYLLDNTNFSSGPFDSSFRNGFNAEAQKNEDSKITNR